MFPHLVVCTLIFSGHWLQCFFNTLSVFTDFKATGCNYFSIWCLYLHIFRPLAAMFPQLVVCTYILSCHWLQCFLISCMYLHIVMPLAAMIPQLVVCTYIFSGHWLQCFFNYLSVLTYFQATGCNISSIICLYLHIFQATGCYVSSISCLYLHIFRPLAAMFPQLVVCTYIFSGHCLQCCLYLHICRPLAAMFPHLVVCTYIFSGHWLQCCLYLHIFRSLAAMLSVPTYFQASVSLKESKTGFNVSIEKP